MFRSLKPTAGSWLLLLAAILAVGPAGTAAEPRRNLLDAESLEAPADLSAPTELDAPSPLDAPMDIGGPGKTFDFKPAGKPLFKFDESAEPEETGLKAAAPVVKAELHPLEGSTDTVVLQVKIEIPAGHYSYSQSKINPKPTRITVDETPGLSPADKTFSESPAAELYFDKDLEKNIEKHTGTVTFSRQYTATDLKGLNTASLVGNVNLLMCKAGACVPFPKLPFKANYVAVPVTLGVAGTDTMVVSSSAGGTLWSNLLLAFVGGIILNVMPCVLPVIGIKVVSFVEQSGENRFRIFALNWTYAAGSLFVFLILGTLAALFSMNSGQVFQSDYFKIVFAVVVFAMALSLLGVFELNLPGVATGFGLSNEKEGLIGAFLSGIIATFLATPCIGPFMGPALGWSVGQPAPVIYSIWIALGLGMSLPYLILGLAPGLVSWLPRPGMWMVRFKQFSGFLLLATVLFLIQPLERRTKAVSSGAAESVPVVMDANSSAPDLMHASKPEVSKPLTGVLIALLGMGIGLWMIGNLYNHASTTGEKWKVRVAATMIAAPIMWYGIADQFGLRLLPSHELAWEDWSEARMNSHLAEGKPLLIDFTADWCTTCKFNEATALNVAATKKFVEENHFVTMKADFTEESPEIKKWLTKFKAGGVPLYVIFPAGDSSTPIAFEGILTKSLILSKLEEAVKRSKSAKPLANATALISPTK